MPSASPRVNTQHLAPSTYLATRVVKAIPAAARSMLVLVNELVARCRLRGFLQVSQECLAELAGRSVRTVRRWVRTLEALGVVAVERPRGGIPRLLLGPALEQVLVRTQGRTSVSGGADTDGRGCVNTARARDEELEVKKGAPRPTLSRDEIKTRARAIEAQRKAEDAERHRGYRDFLASKGVKSLIDLLPGVLRQCPT
jgi:transposase